MAQTISQFQHLISCEPSEHSNFKVYSKKSSRWLNNVACDYGRCYYQINNSHWVPPPAWRPCSSHADEIATMQPPRYYYVHLVLLLLFMLHHTTAALGRKMLSRSWYIKGEWLAAPGGVAFLTAREVYHRRQQPVLNLEWECRRRVSGSTVCALQIPLALRHATKMSLIAKVSKLRPHSVYFLHRDNFTHLLGELSRIASSSVLNRLVRIKKNNKRMTSLGKKLDVYI